MRVCVLAEEVMVAVGGWMLNTLRRELFKTAMEESSSSFWRPILMGWAFALCPPAPTHTQLLATWLCRGYSATAEALVYLARAAESAKVAMYDLAEAWGDVGQNA